jgi:hypothetical protein
LGIKDISLNITSWVFRLEATIHSKGNTQVAATVNKNRWMSRFVVALLVL